MLTSTLLATMVLASPFEVILDRTAGLKVLEEGQSVATVGFTMFRTGWIFHSPVSSPGGEGNPTTAKVTWPGGEAVVLGRVTQLADGLRYELEATPSVNVGVESANLTGVFPTGVWAGSTANIDGTDFPIPQVYNNNQIPWSGNGKTLKMTKGGLEITLEGSSTLPALLQDSRQWGPTLDWRYGTGAGTWQANVKRTYTVTLKSPRGFTFATESPYTITENADWIQLPATLDVAGGSALDWMTPDAKPAGSQGWLQVVNGKFRFQNGATPQRFYGPNLCFSACFPEKADASRLAARLARMGYNAVRLHHFDAQLTGWTRDGASSTALIPAELDKLNYLVASLKRRGIYVSLDLFTIRQIRTNEVRPGNIGMDEYKALMLVDQGARNNLLQFATNLLNTTNPYTGLRWKDDPAIAWICPVNENTMGSSTLDLSPTNRVLFDQAWQAAGNAGNWSYETDAGARFGAQLHTQFHDWMKGQLRAIGVKALITDLNGWRDQKVLAGNRTALDYVDNHNYWDHPSFLGAAWGLPSRGWSNGGMATKSLGGGLQNMALTRVAGKPFTVTEFNFVAPNRYRAEGGLFMGAMAARQDWDALFRFAWSHSIDKVTALAPIDYFDIQGDPAAVASERAILSLFLRRDLDMAADEGVLRVDPAVAGAAGGYSAPMMNQIFTRRLSSSVSTGGVGNLPAPGGVQPVTVDTAKGILTVNSPRTQGIFAPTAESVTVGGLTATLSGHRGALWVSSLDSRPITTSGRMLLSFVTDVQNKGIRFSGPDRDITESWGGLPHLVRVGSAAVVLTVNDPAGVKVYRLDMAGNRLGEVPVTRTATTIAFTASIGGTGGATLYHEISRNLSQNVRQGSVRGAGGTIYR